MTFINTGSTDNQEQVESNVDEIEEGEIIEEMEAMEMDEQEPVIVHLSTVTKMEEVVLIPIKSEMSDNSNQADIIENGGSDLLRSLRPFKKA